MHTAAGRSLWPALIAAVVVAAALVAFFVIRAGADPGPAPTTAPTTAAPSVEPEPHDHAPVDTGDAPTGCLGGSGRDLAMVRATQQQAPHTAFGAVEVAASFYRWVMQYPTPPNGDVETASTELFATTASPAERDLAGVYAQRGDQLVDDVPAGTPFFLSTRDGRWLVEETSTEDRVTVNLLTSYVIDDVMSVDRVQMLGLVMVWEDGAWRAEGAVRPNTEAVQLGGTDFTGGC